MMTLASMIEEKKRYKAHKARVAALPNPYRDALRAFEHYLMYFGPDKGYEVLTMLDDLDELFVEAAANATPLAHIIGEDPVEFIETFRSNYPVGQWIIRQRERLAETIAALQTGPTTSPTTSPTTTA